MNLPEEVRGYNFTFGVIYCLKKNVLKPLAWIVLWALVLTSAVNTFGLFTDDSDVSGWKRSGLRVHHDAKTGIEYLSDGKGGLIRRNSE